MYFINIKLIRSVIIITSIFLYSTSYAATLTVSTSGTDSGNCLSPSPCLTVSYAITQATTGDTISIGAGDYTLTAALDPGSKNLTFQGAGVRGANMTRLIAASNANIFSFGTATNTSTIKGMVLQGSGGASSPPVITSTVAASPTIEGNIINGWGMNGIKLTTTNSNPIIQNNIIVEVSTGVNLGVTAATNGTVNYNTVVGNATYGLYGGTRKSNLVYGGANGINNCSSDAKAINNLVFRHNRNIDNNINCTGANISGNLIVDPRLLNVTGNPTQLSVNANGTATALAATTLTDSTANWAVNQWKGYFLKPDIGAFDPRRFLIISNTATVITVASSLSLTSYGAVGRIYAITDFTYGTNASGANAGDPSLAVPATDIYGNSRTNRDVGAVVASGTSLPSPTTFYVDPAGTDPFGTSTACNVASGTPCKTVNYPVYLAAPGDTVKLSYGTHSLTYPIHMDAYDKRGVTIEGGYDKNENYATKHLGVRGTYMTTLTAPNYTYIFDMGYRDDNSIVRNLVFKPGDGVIIGSGNASPTFENNVFAGYTAREIYFANYTGANPTLRNNIFVGGSKAILLANLGTPINNTIVSAATAGITGGLGNKNNVVYGSGTGVTTCTYGTASYSALYKNTTDYGSGCDGGNNVLADPLFNDVFTGTSTALGTSTLTTGNVTWTANQWQGYFLTPNVNAATPRYFMITSNTAATNASSVITVYQGGLNMTSYGASGNTYQITDFTLKSASTIKDVGTNTGAPSTDIYEVARPQNTTTDIGATESPVVQFTTSSQSGGEAGGALTITASLSAAFGQDVSVPFTVTGTATGGGTDYTITASPITIPAGSTSATITVTPVNDTLDEANETVIVTMTAPGNVTLGATTVHTATITDDDNPPTVSWTASSQSSANESGTMTVTAQLSAASGLDVTLPFTVTGTATGGGTDYSITASPISITAGLTSATATITITSDTLDENNETVILTMGSPTNASLGATTVHTATITDDDNPPTVSWTASSQSSANESGTMTVTAQLSAASGLDVTLPFTVTGTATGGGTDYSITASPISITAGQTTGTATITITSDTLDENNETVIVTMGSPTNASLGTTTVHTATITDNDSPPTVTLSLNGSPIVENNSGVATVTATLSAASGLNVTVDLAFSGTATGGGTDYTASGASLSISAGGTSGNITLTGVSDQIDEDNETAIVDISAVTNGTESGTQQVTATVTDDDTANVVVTQSGGSTTVTEGGATDTFTVVLNSEPTANVVVGLSIGEDIAVNSSQVTFTNQNWNVAQTVMVTAVDDAIAEGNHTDAVQYQVTSIDSKYSGFAVSNTAVTVTDNDAAGVSVVPSGGSTNVTESGTTDAYTVVLTSQPTANVAISITSSTQATASPSSLTFTSGNWNLAQTVTVSAVDDSVAEGNHTTTFSHAASSTDASYNNIGINNLQVDIVDNDTAGVSVLESGSSTSAAEGGASDTYTLVLTSSPLSNVTVETRHDDRVDTSPATVTFTSSNWGTPQLITVNAVDDPAVNGSLASTITHSASSSDPNYNGISVASVTVSVSDDDVEESDEEVTADAGYDVATSDAQPVTLHGRGTGAELSFLWTITSGDGTLTGETTDSPTYRPTDGTKDVELTFTVQAASGENASDTVIIHVIKNDGFKIEKLDYPVIDAVGTELITERTIYVMNGERKVWHFGKDLMVLLPQEGGQPTIAIGQTGLMVIGFPEENSKTGRAYIFSYPVSEMKGQVDLDQPEQVADYCFQLSGSQEGDEFGKYVAVRSTTEDEDQILISAPGEGKHGILYIYDSIGDLMGLVFGSTEVPIQSVLLGDSLHSQDILLGPDNVALNRPLRRQEGLREDQKLNQGPLLDGNKSLTGSIFLEEEGIDRSFGETSQNVYQSATFAGLRLGIQDDVPKDVVLSTEEAVYVYFGKNETEDLVKGVITSDEVDIRIEGAPADSGFGRTVATGDLNGDGAEDIIIGAPDEGEASEGALYIVFGGGDWENVIDLTNSHRVIRIGGESRGDRIGGSLFIQDTDGDGRDEMYTSIGDSTGKITLSASTQEQFVVGVQGGGGCGCIFVDPQSRPINDGQLYLLLSSVLLLLMRSKKRGKAILISIYFFLSYFFLSSGYAQNGENSMVSLHKIEMKKHITFEGLLIRLVDVDWPERNVPGNRPLYHLELAGEGKKEEISWDPFNSILRWQGYKVSLKNYDKKSISVSVEKDR